MARSVGRHHGNLRPALLASALEVLAEGRSPSLREVARRAGASPAAVYHHFADKRALLVAVADEGFRGLGDALAATRGTDATDRLEQMSAAYVRFALEHAAHYLVMFDPALGGDPAAEPTGEATALETSARAAFTQLVTAMAAAGGEEAVGDASRVRRRAVMAWALAHGAVQLAIAGLPSELDPTLDADALALEVGRAVSALAR